MSIWTPLNSLNHIMCSICSCLPSNDAILAADMNLPICPCLSPTSSPSIRQWHHVNQAQQSWTSNSHNGSQLHRYNPSPNKPHAPTIPGSPHRNTKLRSTKSLLNCWQCTIDLISRTKNTEMQCQRSHTLCIWSALSTEFIHRSTYRRQKQKDRQLD